MTEHSFCNRSSFCDQEILQSGQDIISRSLLKVIVLQIILKIREPKLEGFGLLEFEPRLLLDLKVLLQLSAPIYTLFLYSLLLITLRKTIVNANVLIVVAAICFHFFALDVHPANSTFHEIF